MTWTKQPGDDKPLTHQQVRQKIAKATHDVLAGKNPGPQTFHMKSTKKTSDLYPLKLTEQQRSSLIHCTRLRMGLKKKIEEADEGTQVVGFTRKELDHLHDETGEASLYAPSADKKRLMAVQSKVAVFFEEENKSVLGVDEPKTRKNRSAKSSLLYQFKITLHDSKPPIWRRVQVEDCTLEKFHEHIQSAMGWENSHLHQFVIGGDYYGDPQMLGDMGALEVKDSLRTKLSDILPAKGKKFKFRYEYDFGDGWMHEILFEGCPEPEQGKKYPICLEGKLACPPEDCGGLWGYYAMLSALANPKHEQHEHFMEWNDEVDPDKFDAEKATKEMKKGLPNWRE